jgi:hypothetical protein
MEGYIFVVGATKATLAIWISAEHVVVDQQMGNAERLDALGKRLDIRRVGTDFVVWEHCAQLHTV